MDFWSIFFPKKYNPHKNSKKPTVQNSDFTKPHDRVTTIMTQRHQYTMTLSIMSQLTRIPNMPQRCQLCYENNSFSTKTLVMRQRHANITGTRIKSHISYR